MAEIIWINQRRRRVSGLRWHWGWAAVTIGVLSAATAYWHQTTGTFDNRPVPFEKIEVIDGDTIRANGSIFRLVGFDTPERGSLARCQSERLLADRATNRLRQIVAASDVHLYRVTCACVAGTEGTKQCNHGRLCAHLKTSLHDVGDILIGEGLARAYVCRGSTCPPRQSWC
jgi:endonuclease YncB( thermonuclease family)